MQHRFSIVLPTRERYDNGYPASFIAGFLDMLRYDQARVVDWHHDRLGTKVVLTMDRPPTAGRWASFGLHVTNEED